MKKQQCVSLELAQKLKKLNYLVTCGMAIAFTVVIVREESINDWWVLLCFALLLKEYVDN